MSLRIKVNHLVYTVLPLTRTLVEVPGERCVGLHVPSDPAIYLDPTQAPAEQVRTLIHELIHAFYFAYALPRQKRDEERTCLALESPLAGLFRDNPKLPAVFAAAFGGKPIVR